MCFSPGTTKKIKGNIVDGGKNILGKITQKISGKK
jgi:hypothetical protein